MSHKDDKDEASFDDLVSFSTKPPPPGDVHNARTVMAELPEDVLASLKAGNKIDLNGLGLDGAPPSDAVMTRRARPFELEKAVAAVAERGAAAGPVDGTPIATEAAAAISFAIEPPAFPPSVEPPSAGIAPSPAATSAAPVATAATASEPVDAAVPAEPRANSSRAARIAGIIVLLLAVGAIALKFVYPLVRHRLHLP